MMHVAPANTHLDGLRPDLRLNALRTNVLVHCRESPTSAIRSGSELPRTTVDLTLPKRLPIDRIPPSPHYSASVVRPRVFSRAPRHVSGPSYTPPEFHHPTRGTNTTRPNVWKLRQQLTKNGIYLLSAVNRLRCETSTFPYTMNSTTIALLVLGHYCIRRLYNSCSAEHDLPFTLIPLRIGKRQWTA